MWHLWGWGLQQKPMWDVVKSLAELNGSGRFSSERSGHWGTSSRERASKRPTKELYCEEHEKPRLHNYSFTKIVQCFPLWTRAKLKTALYLLSQPALCRNMLWIDLTCSIWRLGVDIASLFYSSRISVHAKCLWEREALWTTGREAHQHAASEVLQGSLRLVPVNEQRGPEVGRPSQCTY